MLIEIRVNGHGENLLDLLGNLYEQMEQYSDADWADFVDQGYQFADNAGGVVARVMPERRDYLVSYMAFKKKGDKKEPDEINEGPTRVYNTTVVNVNSPVLVGSAVPNLKKFLLEEAQQIKPAVNEIVILAIHELDA